MGTIPPPSPTGFEPADCGVGRFALLPYRAFTGINHATTDTSPCSLRVGLTVIFTSCPRAVRKSMRRSTEKVPDRFRINAET
jgi:hypothetical protein